MVFTDTASSARANAQTGTAFKICLNDFKAGELVYRRKDREEMEEMYYVVFSNYYVLRKI